MPACVTAFADRLVMSEMTGASPPPAYSLYWESKMSISRLRLLLRMIANAATTRPIATIPTMENVAAAAPVLERKPLELELVSEGAKVVIAPALLWTLLVAVIAP